MAKFPEMYEKTSCLVCKRMADTRPPTRPPGHPATRPPGHPATRPPGHTPDHRPRPAGHPAIQPAGYPNHPSGHGHGHGHGHARKKAILVAEWNPYFDGKIQFVHYYILLQ